MTTLDYQVNAGENDGYWQSSTFNNTTPYIIFGYSSVGVNSFARWTGVTIPTGATITAAYLSFYRYVISSGTPPACTLYFEKAANPSAITSASDGNSRTKTTASISVTAPTSGTWWNTNDISSIIQELVNSYNYASGAAMQMIVLGGGSGSNYGTGYSYNGNSSYAPKLHIEYTISESGCNRQMNYFGRMRRS